MIFSSAAVLLDRSTSGGTYFPLELNLLKVLTFYVGGCEGRTKKKRLFLTIYNVYVHKIAQSDTNLLVTTRVIHTKRIDVDHSGLRRGKNFGLRSPAETSIIVSLKTKLGWK